MSRPKALLISLIVVLIFSISANLILFQYIKLLYKREQEAHLFPTYNTFPDTINDSVSGKFIIFFGDSRIKNWSPIFAYHNYEVINLGISGETTSEMLLRYKKDILSYKPELVILQAGINDLKSLALFPESSSLIIEECKNNLEVIIRHLTREDIDVIYTSIFPVSKIPLRRKSFMNKSTLKAVTEVNRYIRNLNIEGLYYFDSENILLGGEKNLKHQFYIDELHVNSEAYRNLNSGLKVFIENSIN